MPAQGDSEVTMADLAQTQSSPWGARPQGLALFSKDPFSGQQEPFDLCSVGFNRVDYADVSGGEGETKPRLCLEGPPTTPAGPSEAGL